MSDRGRFLNVELESLMFVCMWPRASILMMKTNHGIPYESLEMFIRSHRLSESEARSEADEADRLLDPPSNASSEHCRNIAEIDMLKRSVSSFTNFAREFRRVIGVPNRRRLSSEVY